MVVLARLSFIVLIILAKVSCSNSHETIYCVKSVISSLQQCNIPQCKNAIHCDTLDFFTQNSSKYFQPNVQFLFLPGYHNHSNRVILNNVMKMTFSGLKNSVQSVIIKCATKNVGFVFHNFIGVIFENLAITNCGQIFTPHYFENSNKSIIRSAALAFDIGENLTLDGIKVFNSQTQGFYINQVKGVINILSCTFQNAVNDRRGESDNAMIGGNSIFSANCSTHGSKTHIYKSFFTKNSNFLHSQECHRFAAGLAIILKCTNFVVNIDEVKFDGNKGCDGGNLALIFFNTSKPFTNSLMISNSLFQNGQALTGGGILVSFVEAVKVHPKVNNCSDGGTKPLDILKITNTSFIKNMARTYGAGILL